MSSKFFMATEYGAPQGRWHFALTRLVEAAEARPRRVSCGCVDQLTGGDVLDDGVEAPLGRRAAQPAHGARRGEPAARELLTEAGVVVFEVGAVLLESGGGAVGAANLDEERPHGQRVVGLEQHVPLGQRAAEDLEVVHVPARRKGGRGVKEGAVAGAGCVVVVVVVVVVVGGWVGGWVGRTWRRPT